MDLQERVALLENIVVGLVQWTKLNDDILGPLRNKLKAELKQSPPRRSLRSCPKTHKETLQSDEEEVDNSQEKTTPSSNKLEAECEGDELLVILKSEIDFMDYEDDVDAQSDFNDDSFCVEPDPDAEEEVEEENTDNNINSSDSDYEIEKEKPVKVIKPRKKRQYKRKQPSRKRPSQRKPRRLCECPGEFPTRDAMELHWTSIHPDLPKLLRCKDCEMLFTTKPKLTSHRKNHGKNMIRVCTFCDRTFTHKATFERHVGKHTGEKPYLCQICGFSSTADSSLKSHMRRIHGEEEKDDRPFKCSCCEGSFKTKSTLTHHFRNVHELGSVGGESE